MSTFQNHQHLENDLVKHLLLHLSDNNVDEKTMSLCLDFKSAYSNMVDNLVHASTLEWKLVTYALCELSSLKKVYSLLISNTSPLSEACQSLIPLNVVLKDLFTLATSKEISLSYCARNTFAFFIVKLIDIRGCYTFDKSIELLWSLMASRQDRHDVLCCFELLRTLLKQMRCENVEICNSFYDALHCFCENNLSNLEDYQSQCFCVRLKLIHEVLLLLPRSHSLFNLLLGYISKSFRSVELWSINPNYRIVFLEIIASFFKFTSSDSSIETCAISATVFLHSVSNETQCQYFLKEPTFVGFGGRLVLNKQLLPEDAEGLSTAEKMLQLNNILSALCITTTTKSHNNLEVFSLAEKSLSIMLGLSSSKPPSADSVFEIFLEQDDSMIEFLLLHLNLFVFAAREERSFLFSPHHLFVEMLQHLSYDSSILLDWLTSNETQFLLYFLRYLKYLLRDFDQFCLICKSFFDDITTGSVTMTLTSLRKSIDKLRAKNLFPYQVSPLLKVLHAVEGLANQTLECAESSTE